ncbi:MAG: hypothetical protein FJX57_03960 [Alphaproteobacteria bacterium]|nr:hypothetical protein [Alphaproteobacteria bacterium]
MTAANRFLFENRFDAAKGVPPPPPPRKSFAPAELDAAKAAAHQAGLAAGRAAAQKEIDARIATAAEALAHGLDGAIAEITARHEAQAREGVMAAAEMVRRLFPAFAARAEFVEFEALLAECLSRLADEPRVVLRIADGLVEAFKPRLDGLLARSSYAGRVILLGDPALGEGQARIEWADGGVERDAPRVWAEIDEILQQHVAGLGMPDPTTP